MLPSMANKIFVRGPERETRAMSLRPSLKLNGSIGTGFAPPKMIGDVRNSMTGRMMLMKGSMCFMGLRVNLPRSLAVGSPSR